LQNDTELIRFIEKAASAANVLSPANMSAAEGLQKILDQIAQTVVERDDCTNQLFQQIMKTSSEAAHLLQEVLNKQIGDTDKSIKSVLQAVSNLQGLIDQIAQEAPAANSLAGQKDLPASYETDAQEDVVVSEEDMPLVLDFISEGGEHIESAEAALLELETKPNDNELLNQIFRTFHSIKGIAGFLNLTDIGSLAHAAENLLDLSQKGKLVLAGKNTDVVFESIDMMKGMINVLKSSVEAGQAVPPEVNLAQLLAKLKTCAEGTCTLEKDSEEKPQNPTSAVCSDVTEAYEKDKTEELLVVKEKQFARRAEDRSRQDCRGGTDHSKSTRPYNGVERRSSAIATEEKVKVSTARLDNLVNMVGELVISQLMIAEEAGTKLSSEHELNRKVTHQGKVIRKLQELSMSMRMVPIQGAFQKMARLVHDLSRKSGKHINFVTTGDEAELDRTIVDKIIDPFVHMVRNSVDHGIESQEEREKAGKDPVGRIELRAFHQAGNIIIEVEDDGRGLSRDRILKKAIENGIVKASQELSDQEIFELIFHAGFSTARKVTNVSGRGVGMDVVKRNIESLRGKVSINSTPGKGTTFTIRLPLTLAIIDGLAVKAGNECYIIPICSIVGIFKPTLKEFSSVQNRGEMVRVRGQWIHMVRLYKLFDIVPKTEDLTESSLVLVEEGSKKCCLLIDELVGHQQVVIKSLGKGLSKVKGISGGAIMGDGKVSLILDVPGLIELAQK
jgi:two-component system chemotaxis sensor kinase CheA